MPRWEPSIFLPAKSCSQFPPKILKDSTPRFFLSQWCYPTSWSKPKAPNPPHFVAGRQQKDAASGNRKQTQRGLWETTKWRHIRPKQKMAGQFLAGVPSELATGRAPKQMHGWRHYVSVGRRWRGYVSVGHWNIEVNLSPGRLRKHRWT